MLANELRTLNPLEMLDRGLTIVRRAGFDRAARAWLAGWIPAAVIFGIYFFERVEGVRRLRPLFAVALVLAWWARALILSDVARAAVIDLWPAMPIAANAGRRVDIVRTCSLAALELWLWLWPLVGLAKLSPFAMLFMLPFLALRGAVAPSWLARSACYPGGGLRSFSRAATDTGGARGVMLLVEFMLLFGAAGLFANLYALIGLVLVLGHSLLGLDVAFVSSFLSPDNNMVLLAVASLVLVLAEPLRAAVSALALVDARARLEGVDLRAAIETAIRKGQDL